MMTVQRGKHRDKTVRYIVKYLSSSVPTEIDILGFEETCDLDTSGILKSVIYLILNAQKNKQEYSLE